MAGESRGGGQGAGGREGRGGGALECNISTLQFAADESIERCAFGLMSVPVE